METEFKAVLSLLPPTSPEANKRRAAGIREIDANSPIDNSTAASIPAISEPAPNERTTRYIRRATAGTAARRPSQTWTGAFAKNWERDSDSEVSCRLTWSYVSLSHTLTVRRIVVRSVLTCVISRLVLLRGTEACTSCIRAYGGWSWGSGKSALILDRLNGGRNDVANHTVVTRESPISNIIVCICLQDHARLSAPNS